MCRFSLLFLLGLCMQRWEWHSHKKCCRGTVRKVLSHIYSYNWCSDVPSSSKMPWTTVLLFVFFTRHSDHHGTLLRVKQLLVHNIGRWRGASGDAGSTGTCSSCDWRCESNQRSSPCNLRSAAGAWRHSVCAEWFKQLVKTLQGSFICYWSGFCSKYCFIGFGTVRQSYLQRVWEYLCCNSYI